VVGIIYLQTKENNTIFKGKDLNIKCFYFLVKCKPKEFYFFSNFTFSKIKPNHSESIFFFIKSCVY